MEYVAYGTNKEVFESRFTDPDLGEVRLAGEAESLYTEFKPILLNLAGRLDLKQIGQGSEAEAFSWNWNHIPLVIRRIYQDEDYLSALYTHTALNILHSHGLRTAFSLVATDKLLIQEGAPLSLETLTRFMGNPKIDSGERERIIGLMRQTQRLAESILYKAGKIIGTDNFVVDLLESEPDPISGPMLKGDNYLVGNPGTEDLGLIVIDPIRQGSRGILKRLQYLF